MDRCRCIFYNDSNNIIDIIKENSETNFIFSNDICDKNINTGIFIIKNCEYCINFLNLWAYDEDLYKNNSIPNWWDQGVLLDMINNNILDIKNNYFSYKYGDIQHFSYNELNKLHNKPYVFHLAGKDYMKRVSICENYYNFISQHNI